MRRELKTFLQVLVFLFFYKWVIQTSSELFAEMFENPWLVILASVVVSVIIGYAAFQYFTKKPPA